MQWTMQGMEEMVWGQPGPLRGQLGLTYIFQVQRAEVSCEKNVLRDF